MGYNLTGYIIDIGDLNRRIGSKDRDLLKTMREEQPIQGVIASHNDFYSDRIRLGDPPLDKALEALIMDLPLDEKFAYAYGYALELICKHLANSLYSEYIMISELDHIFSQKQLKKQVDLHRLIEANPPVVIPKIPDFPGLGHWTAAEVLAAKEALEKTSFNDIGPAFPDLDMTEIHEALAELKAWIDGAVSKNCGIVGFYY